MALLECQSSQVNNSKYDMYSSQRMDILEEGMQGFVER